VPNPMKFFVANYSRASRTVARKVELLAWVVLLVLSLSVALMAIMAVTGAIVVAGMVSALVLLCGFVLFLLRKGRYGAASPIFLTGLFLVMFLAIKFDQYVSIYECYVYGTLGLFLLIISGLVGNDIRFSLVLTGFMVGEIFFVYMVDVLPTQGGVVSLLDTQSLATSCIMVVLGGICSAILVRTQRDLMAESEAAAEEAASRLESTRSAVLKAQDLILESGRGIAEGVRRVSDAVGQLEGLSFRTGSGVESLSAALTVASQVNERGSMAQARMRDSLDAYAREISTESSAVEQMARALDSLSASSMGKRESIARLRSLVQEVETRLDAIKASVTKMTTSADRMREMNSLISDVAERTNMLGMNSSIEAAHLGAAGRGFAVIAGQIRLLSTEAAKGSTTIASMLGETVRSISDAESASADGAAFFAQAAGEIDGISTLIEELLVGLQEVNAGSSNLLGSVGRISDLTATTQAVVDDAEAGVAGAVKSMAGVAESTRAIQDAATAMKAAFDLILKEIESVKGLGDRNIEHVDTLRRDLEAAGVIREDR